MCLSRIANGIARCPKTYSSYEHNATTVVLSVSFPNHSFLLLFTKLIHKGNFQKV